MSKPHSVSSLMQRLREQTLKTSPLAFLLSTGYLGGDDTIFALSSGQGRAGVAVIRVSGPQARQCLQSLITPPSTMPPAPAAKVRGDASRRSSYYTPLTLALVLYSFTIDTCTLPPLSP